MLSVPAIYGYYDSLKLIVTLKNVALYHCFVQKCFKFKYEIRKLNFSLGKIKIIFHLWLKIKPIFNNPFLGCEANVWGCNKKDLSYKIVLNIHHLDRKDDKQWNRSQENESWHPSKVKTIAMKLPMRKQHLKLLNIYKYPICTYLLWVNISSY